MLFYPVDYMKKPKINGSILKLEPISKIGERSNFEARTYFKISERR
jgi:hypothetical protein